VSDGPVPADPDLRQEDQTGAGAEDFPGDRPAAEGEGTGAAEANADDGTASVSDPNLAIADKLIADLAFESKAGLLTMQASGKYRGFVAMMKVQHPDKSDQVEKAMQDALDAFG
jgi:hypothetical protein